MDEKQKLHMKNILHALKKIGIYGGVGGVLGGALLFGASWHVYAQGKQFIVDAQGAEAPVVIVPGAGLKRDGTPSDVLRDRLMVALAMYQDGRVDKILCSGDNGQVQYDEVNAMREWLLARGVAPEDLFLDHAGFDTYDTMVRAAEVFGVTEAIIVTQDFHLPRALYVANAQGIVVQGVSASLESYVKEAQFIAREIPARIKAFYEVITKAEPRYGGEPIEITGDGRVTWDEGSEEL